ncbi:MAG: glycogen/starch/alpha-glucan phosphorylase, partial [Deltaproteobacteria bacterium]|nr:glycogen/starch/alpha-glucan phosphorylase [Deltaproteobacteria bacterium]
MAKPNINWNIHYKHNDVESLKHAIMNNLEYRLAKDHYSATRYDRFLSTSYAIMERLVERWIATQQSYHNRNPKRIYYLSMEFLLGKALENSLINLGIYDACRDALEELGMDLTTVLNDEVDAGLGNGGLGRLAACFLDSMATLCIPAQGYGIRYEYGLFHQRLANGRQVEVADNWLARPTPWEIERPEYYFKVRFGGEVKKTKDPFGMQKTSWSGGEELLAMAYDLPVPGYMTNNVNTLRLWSSKASEEFSFPHFNIGDYIAACEKKFLSENITKVLYPNDNFFEGKELRLKQEFLLVSATIQDILRRFKTDNKDLRHLPDKVAIQLNDTHPALAIPELMRILIDEEEMEWNTAWDICRKVFAYTNHTVLPEALEEWPVDLIERLLPRHLQIIYAINHHLIKEVSAAFPGDDDRIRRMSIVAEEGHKRIRMAYLAVVGSHKVNGVAELHSQLVKETLLNDFYTLWPEKFTNKTNGVTPRRWIKASNPSLAELITETIGDGWLKDLDQLRNLEQYADDESFQQRWREVKFACKQRLADTVWNEEWIELHPATMIDVQVKRIHEYKRQLLFALYIISRYIELKENPKAAKVPRTCIIGGKAAPGYERAKLIIKLINNIAVKTNNNSQINANLRTLFLPNYRVSLAERLIPAADLSEQISTAGMEASGTGNMKFALNGALTIGTLDGANIEILEEVGDDNIFIFGLKEPEVRTLKQNDYNPQSYIDKSPLLQRVMEMLKSDYFCKDEPGLFRPIYDDLIHNDHYCLMADFDAYVKAQAAAEEAYLDTKNWTKMSILNVARCGKFSSDRTIKEYAEEIWNVEGMTIELEDDT